MNVPPRDLPPRRTQWRDTPGFRPGRVGQLGPKPTAIQRWALECPLWKWRIGERATRMVAASLLGVSHTTVQSWEYGRFQPNSQNMKVLAALLGAEIHEEWAEWMSRRPKVPVPLTRSDPEVQAILREQEARARAMADDMARQLAELDALIGGEEGREDAEDSGPG